MSYRVAIIGCGMIAGYYEDFAVPATYSHAKAYLRNGVFGELGFYDRHPERAEALAAKAGGKAYDSIEELLSSFRPDVVSVCVTDDEHFAVMEPMMRSAYAPRLIFAEKPVCTRRDELERLLELQSAGGPVVIVNHSRRFDTAHQRIRELLARRELGEPVRVHVDYYGGWRHMGVHIVDTLQFFFDGELHIDRLDYACGSKYVDDPTLNVEGSIASATVRLDGFLEDFYQILDMNIMCEAGQIKLTDFGNRIDVLRKTVNAEHENVLELDADCSGSGMNNPICNAVDLMAEYLENGDHCLLVPFGMEQAAKTMNVIWKGSDAYQS